jgi:hypothetical protein
VASLDSAKEILVTGFELGLTIINLLLDDPLSDPRYVKHMTFIQGVLKFALLTL